MFSSEIYALMLSIACWLSLSSKVGVGFGAAQRYSQH
jgi:hypothetical protein